VRYRHPRLTACVPSASAVPLQRTSNDQVRTQNEVLTHYRCLWHAAPETLGGRPSLVQPTTVACAQHRQGHELDIVVSRKRPGQGTVVLAIGEAKSTVAAVGVRELERLEHLRDLIPSDRVETPPRLLLFSRSGFTTDPYTAATTRPDVDLIDLARLYQGS